MPRYIGLMKYRKKTTNEMVIESLAQIKKDRQMGVIVHEIYWTLGQYDAVIIFDAPDEKIAMKFSIARADDASVETMVAIPLNTARKLAE